MWFSWAIWGMSDNFCKGKIVELYGLWMSQLLITQEILSTKWPGPLENFPLKNR